MRPPHVSLLVCFALLAPAAFGGPAPCPAMTQSNIFIGYQGTASGCSPFVGGPCQVAEQIDFVAQSFQYDFSCALHTFAWNFGDGTTATGKTPVHTYAAPGTYAVTITISNGSQTFTTSAVVTVAAAAVDIPSLSFEATSLLLMLLALAALGRLR